MPRWPGWCQRERRAGRSGHPRGAAQPAGPGRQDGAFAQLHPVDLLAQVLTGLVTSVGVDPVEIDDVIAGCVSQVGEQSSNIARNAVLAAGFPESVPGTTVDRQCGSSQQDTPARRSVFDVDTLRGDDVRRVLMAPG
jgi:hypothetical protein